MFFEMNGRGKYDIFIKVLSTVKGTVLSTF